MSAPKEQPQAPLSQQRQREVISGFSFCAWVVFGLLTVALILGVLWSFSESNEHWQHGHQGHGGGSDDNWNHEGGFDHHEDHDGNGGAPWHHSQPADTIDD